MWVGIARVGCLLPGILQARMTQKPKRLILDLRLPMVGHRRRLKRMCTMPLRSSSALGSSVSRTTVAEAMARGSLKGLTGEIRFDADHRRSDDGVVYTVVGSEAALRVVVMP